jgi:hypothetical protein
MPDSQTMAPHDFQEIYDRFQASISRYDCGKFCAPLNGGSPVCCSVDHAIPVVQKSEWKLLKGRTDLWRTFKAFDKASQDIVDDLSDDCKAIQCKGARFCERDNRTLACRAFPFFPYFDRNDKLVGISYYWDFEDRCWVISNLQIVEREFVREFVSAYEYLFEKDPDEYQAYREQSQAMRRVFSRWRRAIPIIGREGGYLKELPKGRGLVKAKVEDFAKHGPYKSAKAFAREVRALGAVVPYGWDNAAALLK